MKITQCLSDTEIMIPRRDYENLKARGVIKEFIVKTQVGFGEWKNVVHKDIHRTLLLKVKPI